MAGKDLGSKHVCFKCSTKFYDFKKPEPICPKCGANQTHAAPSTQLAATQAARKKRKAEVARTFDDEPEEVVGEVVADDELIDDELVGADLGTDEEEADIDDDEE